MAERDADVAGVRVLAGEDEVGPVRLPRQDEEEQDADREVNFEGRDVGDAAARVVLVRQEAGAADERNDGPQQLGVPRDDFGQQVREQGREREEGEVGMGREGEYT